MHDSAVQPHAAVPQRTSAPAARKMMPGVMLALAVFCLYGGIALSIDFPGAARGMYSDEATYYMMGHSLAEDGDLTYRRKDLMRVWREFQGGPAGVFLKRGRDITGAGLMRRPPFFWTTSVGDPDSTRLFYGKSFIYPVFAWPFVDGISAARHARVLTVPCPDSPGGLK